VVSLFIVLGIAVLTLLALLLWFVPHLLQQQAQRASGEADQLRKLLLDVLNEQELVTVRQAQLGTSLAYLQDQLEVLVQRPALPALPSPELRTGLTQIEQRLGALQQQIETWQERPLPANQGVGTVDSESWSNLMSLLTAIQMRLGELSADEGRRVPVGGTSVQARHLLEELDRELDHLHGIADDISKLQWRLRQSLNGRELGRVTPRSNARSLQLGG
jgi:septation ring formation regulator EzrA